MANFISAPYNAFANIGTVTATSEQAAYPAMNTTLPTFPNQVFKTSSAAGTSQSLVIDFGAQRTLNAVVVDNTNVTAIKVQGNATDSWGSPSVQSLVTISQDGLDGRYKTFVDLSGGAWTSTGYRYMRVVCNTATTQFGGSVWIVGSVIPIVTTTTWGTNVGPSHGRARLQAVDSGIKTGGGMEPSGLGNAYARIIIPAADIDVAMQTTYDALMQNGEHNPMVFYRNLSSTAEVYCCHRVGVVRVDYGGASYLSPDALVLEEYA